jgi:prevent-host-death family protein
MTMVNVRAARENFSALLATVARGESVTITRRGKPIARVSPAAKSPRKAFPDLSAFRAKMRTGGKEVTITDLRNAERY